MVDAGTFAGAVPADPEAVTVRRFSAHSRTTGGSDDFAITIRDQLQRPVSAVILPDLTALLSFL